MAENPIPPIPPKKSGMKKKKIILYAIGIFILLGAIANCGGGNSTSTNGTNSDSNSVATDSTIASNSSSSEGTTKEEKTWAYDSSVDEMNDSKSKFASLISDNTVDFDFPYQGGSSLSVTVRNTKKWGTDVFIKISKGQFVGSEYDGTNYVKVRFDNGAPMKFTTNEPSDGSSDMLFLNNPKKFITQAKKAKRILIEAQFYEEGNQVFTFTVDKPLEW